MATDEHIRRKEETPASASQSAKTKMGQEMVFVHQQSGSRHVDVDDDFNPTDEELAFVAGKQSVALDDCDNPDGDVGYGPLRIVRPESMESGQEKRPCSRYKERAKKTRAKKTSTGLTRTYNRKRGRPAGSKSAKSKIEQKSVLFDSGSSGSSGYSKGDKDDDFEPPTPTRKRGRPTRSKSAKRKIEQEPLLFDSSSSSSSEGKKDKDDDFQPEVSDGDDGRKKCTRGKGTAWDRARELEEKLSAVGPSFVKRMKQSHVVRGFWLGLPASFCRNHLPKQDVDIVLEDEEGETWDTRYLAYKTGLSGGWQGFVKQQHLKVGDAVVFQVVQPIRFKVYILRENEFTGTDGALGPLSLNTSMESHTSRKEEESSDKDIKSKEEEPEDARVNSKGSDDDSNYLANEEGVRYSDPDTDDSSLVNFKIVLGDGSVVGRRALPDGLRRTYYNLCQARKAFLHRHVAKHISPALATQLIVDTAKIAEGIMASSPSSIEDLAGWKKTLELFESMGMDVAFMHKRVDDLLGLLSAPTSTSVEPAGYEEVKLRRASAVKQLRYLESSVSIVKDALKEMDAEMEEMVEASAKKQKDQAVRKLATVPW